jgi:hypothetical protein
MNVPEQETPWLPSKPEDLPFSLTLVNPHGTRHIGLNEKTGIWHRVWQNRPPEPLHTGEAVFLRPSDVDQIIKASMMWSAKNWDKPRAGMLNDELAEGVKQLVLHYAAAAGEVPKTRT